MPVNTPLCRNGTLVSISLRLKNLVVTHLQDLVDILAPPPTVCSLCNRQLPPPILPISSFLNDIQQCLCRVCLLHLAWVQPPLCARCGRPSSQSLCRFCSRNSAALVGCCPLVYTGTVRELVHIFKYQSQYELGEPLGYIMGAAATRIMSDWYPDALVPVPLHYDRLEQRGYNQAELLAYGVGRFLRRPVWLDAVVRQKATPSQSTLSPIERKKNMQAAFAVPTPGNVAQRNILVVDDVHTTGATLTSLGMELYRAGASSVRFVTLAVAVEPSALAGNLLEVEQEAFSEQRI